MFVSRQHEAHSIPWTWNGCVGTLTDSRPSATQNGQRLCRWVAIEPEERSARARSASSRAKPSPVPVANGAADQLHGEESLNAKVAPHIVLEQQLLLPELESSHAKASRAGASGVVPVLKPAAQAHALKAHRGVEIVSGAATKLQRQQNRPGSSQKVRTKPVKMTCRRVSVCRPLLRSRSK
jgi:hypothetical protein